MGRVCVLDVAIHFTKIVYQIGMVETRLELGVILAQHVVSPYP